MAEDRDVEADRSVVNATVTLLRGKTNRIYAMASRETEQETPGGPSPEPASIDGLSNFLDLEYDGPAPDGRTHVLALGISAYQGQPLRYADEDARAIAGFLSRQGRGTEPIVRVNKQVTIAAVEKAFEDLRKQANPEDTVVVFLAGHTTINRGRFSLLLPSAPLPDPPRNPGQLALRAPSGRWSSTGTPSCSTG